MLTLSGREKQMPPTPPPSVGSPSAHLTSLKWRRGPVAQLGLSLMAPLAVVTTEWVCFQEGRALPGNCGWRLLMWDSQRPRSESSFLGHEAQCFLQLPLEVPELGHGPGSWCSLIQGWERERTSLLGPVPSHLPR